MYRILIVYPQIYVKIHVKNRRASTVIEKEVYKTVLQRAGWALPRPFLYLQFFSQ
jgi:hypothetical protein